MPFGITDRRSNLFLHLGLLAIYALLALITRASYGLSSYARQLVDRFMVDSLQAMH
jgi:hypothetical protein